MPFWGGWSDPKVEPKRGFRFVVPFPIYVPAGEGYSGDDSQTLISRTLGATPGAIDPEMLNMGRYGKNKYFEFLAASCTKPGFKTEVYKISPGGATSHPIVRPNQATTYEFSPVKIELIDTYSHDLASSLTAYLYAYGGLKEIPEGSFSDLTDIAKQFTPGKLIPFHNTSVADEFHIIEFMPAAAGSSALREAAAEGGQSPARLFRGRQWILKNPYITSVDFGTYNYASTELARVSIEIAYDSYDYNMIIRPSADDDNRLQDTPGVRLEERHRIRGGSGPGGTSGLVGVWAPGGTQAQRAQHNPAAAPTATTTPTQAPRSIGPVSGDTLGDVLP